MLKIFRHSALKLIIIFLAICCLYIVYTQMFTVEDEVLKNERVVLMEKAIFAEDNKFVCKQPVLPINSPEMMKFVKEVPKISCLNTDNPDWVLCEDSECFIKDSIKSMMDGVKCKFTDLKRVSDHNVRDAHEYHISEDKYTLRNSDVVKIQCNSNSNEWSSIKTAIRADPEILQRTGWNYTPKNGLKMNVLMFGLDSVSRNTFIRKLPLSYKYLVDVLGAHVLEGYNIVGDGTPQALTPILTGFTELELPDVRKRYLNTQYVDVYPFIWYNYSKNGYVTAFFEDLPSTGTYTYRLNGFKKQPTDHYMRPYYLASNSYYSKWKRLCDGEIPRHKVMLNHIKNFFSVYKEKPKFLFGFHGELSHDDYNLVGIADEDIVDFFRDLNESGALNNTILIVMADHGHRFADIRNTLQGKLEERMPFFSFRFPPWFKTTHKDLYDTFVSNLHVLTTPFDIHSTLHDILEKTSPIKGNLSNRSLSLFSSISETRTCANAYIEPHWCACLDWDDLNPNDEVVPLLIKAFLDTVNGYTNENRDICAELTVSDVMSVTKLKANDKLMKFKQTSDRDGFAPNLSGSTKVLTEMYQIKVKTTPGDGIYEASITHPVTTNDYNLKLSDVSRINMYGDQARCIVDTQPNLRKYCYCLHD
nr:uncharacterized protein LOC111424779 isoform X1 [Onthophagus taurus]